MVKLCHTDKVIRRMSLKSIELYSTARSDNRDVSVMDSIITHWTDTVENLSISLIIGNSMT